MTFCFIIFYFCYTNFSLTFFEYFELKSYDLRYKFKDMVSKDKKRDYDVIIVGIDEKSLMEIGKWPWSRNTHGDVVKILKENGVKSIGFDISFTEGGVSKEVQNYKKNIKNMVADMYNQQEIDEDKAVKLLTEINKLKTDEDYEFAEALKNTGNVSIGTYNIVEESKEIEEYDMESSYYKNSRYYNIEGIEKELIEIGRTGDRRVKPYEIYKMVPPIDIIGQFCYGIAPYDVGTPDPDGVLRGIVSVTKEKYSGLYFPPLYLLVYLNSKGYSMEKNVVFDMNNSKIDIYKDALNRTDIINEIPTNKDGYQRLFFYGKGHTFKYFSFIDVLSGKIDKKQLNGKIVLIGYTDSAKGLYDLRSTPLDPNTPGVELHATAIQNLIDKKYMERSGLILSSLFMAVFMILLSLVMAIKKIKAIIANILAVCIIMLYFITSYLLFLNGIWIELFYPVVVLFFIWTILNGVNYFTEEVEKKYIRNIFGHYISPELVEELIKTPEMIKLGGEKKELTAFFSDIAGFTTISEKLTPEELVEYLNDYLSVMSEIILRNNGTIDKYIGDAIMAIFGAPLFSEKNAEDACYAALEYQEKLDLFRKKCASNGKPLIYARIGINTGEMIVGNMGCNIGKNKKFNYTVIGDEVNLASRLEGINKFYKTSIIISEGTYKKVRKNFEVRFLEKVVVKGMEKSVEIYELVGEKNKIDEKVKEKNKIFEAGIELYRKKMWIEANKKFQDVINIDINDGPAELYRKRTEEYVKNPPDDNWSDVYIFKEK